MRTLNGPGAEGLAGISRFLLRSEAIAANAALDELRQAGILTTKSIERGATAYISREVLDVITLAERAWASTHFDTRVSPPNRSVPARLQE